MILYHEPRLNPGILHDRSPVQNVKFHQYFRIWKLVEVMILSPHLPGPANISPSQCLPGPITTFKIHSSNCSTQCHNCGVSPCPSFPLIDAKSVSPSTHPPRDGGRCSSSPQSRSPSPEGEQLPPPWQGPPPCSLLPGIPAPRTFYGPAWHGWRPWRCPAPAGAGNRAVGSVSDSPAPTRGERSRRLGPAQPSRTREEAVKKRGQRESSRRPVSAGCPEVQHVRLSARDWDPDGESRRNADRTRELRREFLSIGFSRRPERRGRGLEFSLEAARTVS